MTWNKLKWIAAAAMLIDHIAAVLVIPLQPFLFEVFGVDYVVTYYGNYVMRCVGRLAFPIFAYGITQGCAYTRDPKKYLLRLGVFALISEIPFNLAIERELTFGMHNVLFTLFLGAVCCFLWEYFASRGRAWIAVVLSVGIIALAQFADTDYAGIGVACIFLPYVFFEKKSWRLLCVAACVAVEYVLIYNWPLLAAGQGFSPASAFFLLGGLCGVGLLALYNGKPGSKKAKYFFYGFYPAHLLLLAVLNFTVFAPYYP